MRRVLVVAMAMAMVLALAPAASAGANGAVQIGGMGQPIGPAPAECNGVTSLFTIVMDGNLEGCWYTDVIEEDSVKANSSGTYAERGEETFVGCWVRDGYEDVCGSFRTTYHFTAKFAPSDGSQVFGRCQHPIIPGSGTEGFEGVTGRIDFKDNVDVGDVTYRGHLKLAA